MSRTRQLFSTVGAVAVVSCSGQARAPEVARDSAPPPLTVSAPEARVDPSAVPTIASGWVVSFDGVGPLRVGMDEQQARAAIGAGLHWPSGPSEGCDYAFVEGVGEQLALMINDGHVARVDVNTPSIPTAAGARVGDLEARIRQLYGPGIEVKPHKYEEGHYLIISTPRDTSLRLIFETRRDTVTMFRAGRRPEVEWVEACA